VLAWSLPRLAESPTWQALRARIEQSGAAALALRVEGLRHFVHASAGDPTAQCVWPAHEIPYLFFNGQIDERLVNFLDAFLAVADLVALEAQVAGAGRLGEPGYVLQDGLEAEL
jgi:hypothetical protein